MGSDMFYFVLTEELFDNANKIHLKVSLPVIYMKYPFSLGHVYYRLDFKLISVLKSFCGYQTSNGSQAENGLKLFSIVGVGFYPNLDSK